MIGLETFPCMDHVYFNSPLTKSGFSNPSA
jgi:hypothetical protein